MYITQTSFIFILTTATCHNDSYFLVLADLVVCSRWVCEGGRVVISVPNYLLNHAEQHICFQDHVENFILTKMKLTIERVSRTGLREFHYNENKPRNCKEVVVSFTKLSSELMLYSQEIVAISLAPGRTHVSTNRAVSSDSSSASYRTIIHSNDQLFNLFQQLESGFKFRSQAENHLLAISAVFSAYFVQWVLQCVASKNQNQDSPQATTMASRDGERIQVLLTSVGK